MESQNVGSPHSVIVVRDEVDSRFCVSVADGERIYKRIVPYFERGIPVCLSFEGVEIVISAFLNAAIGQLIGQYKRIEIENMLSYRGLADRDISLIHRVIENAESYFARPKDYDWAWEEEFGQAE